MSVRKIGLLYGMENSFPMALVERINSRKVDGVVAESLQTGGFFMDRPSPYRLIIDRISHDIPFYRAYLKNAILHGSQVINNPFWWSADDKFFNYALGAKMGVAVRERSCCLTKSIRRAPRRSRCATCSIRSIGRRSSTTSGSPHS